MLICSSAQPCALHSLFFSGFHFRFFIGKCRLAAAGKGRQMAARKRVKLKIILISMRPFLQFLLLLWLLFLPDVLPTSTLTPSYTPSSTLTLRSILMLALKCSICRILVAVCVCVRV